MSDNDSTITVTRGTREERSQQKQSSSTTRSRSSDLGLPGPGALVTGVVRGVRTAWWAGLGAFAVAQDAGSKIFDALVEEGKSWEQQRRETTERTAEQVQQLTEDGTKAVEAVEERVRNEVNDALQQLGVPRRDDVEELHDQVNDLAEKMDQLAEAVSEQQTADDP